MDTYIYLIGKSKVQDETGVWRETSSTPVGVFAQVKSVTRNEFFDGGRNGLNPQYQFTIFRGDYNNETIVKYEGLTYAIYRTYIANSDYIELYAERQGGTNAENESDTD